MGCFPLTLAARPLLPTTRKCKCQCHFSPLRGPFLALRLCGEEEALCGRHGGLPPLAHGGLLLTVAVLVVLLLLLPPSAPVLAPVPQLLLLALPGLVCKREQRGTLWLGTMGHCGSLHWQSDGSFFMGHLARESGATRKQFAFRHRISARELRGLVHAHIFCQI